ncbi:ataxin-2 [Drosophila ficusphila]|uniref:ataxin-2 n=1 Tax=Drosophila ficusphila TaxID=30025 RepID=UPI0007E608EA|nr:ataxin-2 [Drosophila ficusphila]XP_017043426.1 ataxin-2 [Drosophila ficusphila]
MSNVEIYDSSNSQLSSDEYSHGEEEYDALMDEAVSKERPQKTKSKESKTVKPGNGSADPAMSSDKEDKPKTKIKPPSTRSETHRRIRQLRSKRIESPCLYFKRRSIKWLRINKAGYDTYLEGLADVLPNRDKAALVARFKALWQTIYAPRSPSRSLSRSRSRSPSRSRSRSRSPSRSYSVSRSASHSPELICLDDTENEESPEKPEMERPEKLTPLKENKPRAVIALQLDYELPENLKATLPVNTENGASNLDEFLVKNNDPQQACFGFDTLSACMELEQALSDRTLVQQEEPQVAESLVMDASLKRRRSVTPPTETNEKRSDPDPEPVENLDEDDDTIEFMPVQEQKKLAAQPPPLNLQMPSTPVANLVQSQPGFRLSTPYSLSTAAGEKTDNLASISYSLNTPTPPVTPMEISYPNEQLPNNTKVAMQNFPAQQAASPQVAAAYASPFPGASPAQRATPVMAASPSTVPLQRAPPQQMPPPRSASPQQLAAPHQMAVPARTTQHVAPPHQMAPPRSTSAQILAPPHQMLPPRSTSLQGLASPHQMPPPRPSIPQELAVGNQLASSRSSTLQELNLANQMAPPRSTPTQEPVQANQIAPPRSISPQQMAFKREASPQQLPPARITPPQLPPQVHPHMPPAMPASFVVPQQPQPRRSETVSTQTQVSQPQSQSPPPPTSSTSRQKPTIDLNNSDANFHYRIKGIYEDFDPILTDKVNSVHPETSAFREERERLDADLKTLDNLIAQKEDEFNRLLHLRCVKVELRARMERKERMSFIKNLLPDLLSKSCSNTELVEMQKLLEEEQEAPIASKYGLSAVEKVLNHAELNQNNIRLLRGVMGLKEQAPPVDLRHFEEEKLMFRRNSLPARHLPMRNARDMDDELQPDFDSEMPPLAKRPKFNHPHDRYYQEMTNSTPNLTALYSLPLKKLLASEKPTSYSNVSLDNHFENESHLRPLFNSSPMVSRSQLASKKHRETHSSYRNEEDVVERKPKKDKTKSRSQKSNNSQRDGGTTINGKEDRRCHQCKRREATYLCSSCQTQWYCSRECQLLAWDTHYQTCGI